MTLDHCPHCQVSLQGDPIPEEHRKWYGTSTHYRKEIGIEIMGVYDGVLFWKCKDCGGTWHRWPEGHDLRARAEPFINGPQP